MEGKTVLFKPHGTFNLWQGIDLWERYQPDASPFDSYVFDLQEVSKLPTSGKTWLYWFLRWANGARVRVQIINLPNTSCGYLQTAPSVAEPAPAPVNDSSTLNA